MKTDNIYFHCKNGKVESDLVKAIEALPEEGMSILPRDAEMGCMKKDGKIIIYPHNPEQHLCTLGHIELKDYDEYHREAVNCEERGINQSDGIKDKLSIRSVRVLAKRFKF